MAADGEAGRQIPNPGRIFSPNRHAILPTSTVGVAGVAAYGEVGVQEIVIALKTRRAR
jgi:hypothetical protein